VQKFMLVIAAVAVVAAAGCSSDPQGVTVEDAWGRPSPAAAANGAFYMTIVGGSEADTLTSASSEACGTTELHETTMTDGAMSMQPVAGGIPVPADGTVTLEPGGLHVMCLDVGDGFVVGDSVSLELTFTVSGEMAVSAEIREE
jgi:hypothetical protein